MLLRVLFVALLLVQAVGVASVRMSYDPIPGCWPCPESR
jgi:hypothetical protein